MIVETVKAIQMHLSRASATGEELTCFLDTLSTDDFSNPEKVKVIDAFLFRFIKIQDLMGNKLFREVLGALGEYEDSMSMLDVLDRLEKIKLIESANCWLDYRNLRNLLTHEYPDNQHEIIEGIKMAVDAFEDIGQSFAYLKQYLIEKHVLVQCED